MKTLSEREEHRLLHGKDYVSLPDDIADKEKVRWRELETTAHAEGNLRILAGSKGTPQKAPYTPAGTAKNGHKIV